MTKETLIVAGLAIAAAVLGSDHRGGEGLDGWSISDPEPDPEPEHQPKRQLKDKEQPRVVVVPVDESRPELKRTITIMKGDLERLRDRLENR